MFRLSLDSTPTTLAVSHAHSKTEALSLAAVGFSDGSILLLYGDIARERAARTRIAPAPGELIHPKPILFLSFVDDILYAVTEMSVVAVLPKTLADGTVVYRRNILDNIGASHPRRCCILHRSAELVVARDEALYFFNREGRGPCLAFPTVSARALVAPVGQYLLHASAGTVTAYDVTNKLIAYRAKGTLACAFPSHEKNECSVVLCFDDGVVLRLDEISLDQRVGLLLKRGLYVPAVMLARAETKESGRGILTKALRQYAEYLMTKGRYDQAADQLVETIAGDDVEPSWVITRLVEQPGLRSGLRLYLEALHAQGKAAFVHTKVLITCYRHDRARAAILGSKLSEKTTDEYVINVFSDVVWTEDQVDAAIKLCRDAALYKVAERVARRRGRYVQLARTLVEDMGHIDQALDLLKTLTDADAVRVINACGRQILLKSPKEFVEYLGEAICRSTKHAVTDAQPVLQTWNFLPLFIDMARWRARLLEKVLNTSGGVPKADLESTWILLFESLVSVDVEEKNRIGRKPSVEGNEEPDAKGSVVITGRRALKVLQSRRSVMDLHQALKIAEVHGHESCLEYLYEHLRLYKELGAMLRLNNNAASLLRAARRHGEREAMLWVECVRLFAPIAAKESAGEATDESSGQEILDEALIALERSGELSQLEIVDIVVEACGEAKWGIVREFFERSCAELSREAERSEHAGMVLMGEMTELRREAERLGEEAEVVNLKTCSACGESITVPFVYFFCGHGYRAGCLSGRDEDDRGGVWVEECPKCAPELDAMVSMKQALQDKNGKHDEFFGLLDNSRDGYKTVMEVLERSPFI